MTWWNCWVMQEPQEFWGGIVRFTTSQALPSWRTHPDELQWLAL